MPSSASAGSPTAAADDHDQPQHSLLHGDGASLFPASSSQCDEGGLVTGGGGGGGDRPVTLADLAALRAELRDGFRAELDRARHELLASLRHDLAQLLLASNASAVAGSASSSASGQDEHTNPE